MGAFNHEVRHCLSLDPRPWLVPEVKLTQLYNPLENRSGPTMVLQNLPPGLVHDYLHQMSLKVGFGLLGGFDEHIHQLLRLGIPCFGSSHDFGDIIRWPLDLVFFPYQDTAEHRL
ncbi:hypothetical protein LIER_21131 [Lithospermum erythrorhizon]|uniref:Uncharacterized protein n=1 Tax=Lithospermum erythrorhizon TaxID=34254 RepID=A0AAV3QQ94_LITER